MRALLLLLLTFCILQNYFSNADECVDRAMSQFPGTTFEEFQLLPGKARDDIGDLANEHDNDKYKKQCLSIVDELFEKVTKFYNVYDKCEGIVSAHKSPDFAKRVKTVCYFDENERKAYYDGFHNKKSCTVYWQKQKCMKGINNLCNADDSLKLMNCIEEKTKQMCGEDDIPIVLNYFDTMIKSSKKLGYCGRDHFFARTENPFNFS